MEPYCRVLNEAATLIESQASEIVELKWALDNISQNFIREEAIQRLKEAKALLAKIKPATISVEARGSNAKPA